MTAVPQVSSRSFLELLSMVFCVYLYTVFVDMLTDTDFSDCVYIIKADGKRSNIRILN